MSALADEFSGVTFLEVADVTWSTPRAPGRDHHDELRSRALAMSRGDIVALLEDHEYADPGWAARVLDAHAGDVDAVGGAVENSVDRALNWAVYFCDFGRYQNPVAPGPSRLATDVNVSYKRSALERVAPVWRTRFHERLVHAALLSQGGRLALSPAIVVFQRRIDLTLGDALRERFIWGRSYASARAEHWRLARRAAIAALTPALPPLLLSRMALTVARKRRCRGAFLRALPLTALLVTAWSIGELAGYLSSPPLRLGERDRAMEAV